MSKIVVDGHPYTVVEDLRYNHDAGCWAKAVDTPDGERIAVQRIRGGEWSWWKPIIRMGGAATGQASGGGEGEK